MTTEVRRCARCGEPSVISVGDWGTRMLGGLVKGSGVSRRDYRCQSCGRGFAIDSSPLARFIVGGFIGLQFLFIGGFVLASSFVMLWEDPAWGAALMGIGGMLSTLSLAGTVHFTASFFHHFRNPIVPDAAPPEVVLQESQPPRQCRCGHPAPLRSIVANRTNFVPTGTDYTYQCPQCESEFTVSNVWGLLFGLLAFCVLAPVGWLFATVPPGGADALDWENLACVAFFAIASLGAMAASVWGAAKRWVVHRVIDDGDRLSPS